VTKRRRASKRWLAIDQALEDITRNRETLRRRKALEAGSLRLQVEKEQNDPANWRPGRRGHLRLVPPEQP
jgi:hypothetical protein